MNYLEKLEVIVGLFVCIGCNTIDKNNKPEEIVIHKSDTTTSSSTQSYLELETDPYDSLANVKVDTSTLKGKREFLMNQFMIDNKPSGPDSDTLIDLNFDGEKDYVIKYYGQAGNGFKNRMRVFLYDKKHKSYIYNDQLSSLPNPTFYIKQKKITSFYIAGSGSGRRLEWINGKWTETKIFHIDGHLNEDIWEIEYPLKRKKEKIKLPFEMIPPKEVLETEIELY